MVQHAASERRRQEATGNEIGEDELGFGSVRREESERMTLRSESAGDQVFLRLIDTTMSVSSLYQVIVETDSVSTYISRQMAPDLNHL